MKYLLILAVIGLVFVSGCLGQLEECESTDISECDGKIVSLTGKMEFMFTSSVPYKGTVGGQAPFLVDIATNYENMPKNIGLVFGALVDETEYIGKTITVSGRYEAPPYPEERIGRDIGIVYVNDVKVIIPEYEQCEQDSDCQFLDGQILEYEGEKYGCSCVSKKIIEEGIEIAVPNATCARLTCSCVNNECVGSSP